MSKTKIISLLQSEAFLAKLNDSENIAETKKLFESEGITLSDEKAAVIIDALKFANQKARDGEVIDESELESISGGGLIKKLWHL